MTWRLTNVRNAGAGEMDYTFTSDTRTCDRRTVIIEYWASIEAIFYRFNNDQQIRRAPIVMRDVVHAARAYVALTENHDFSVEDLGI